MPRYVDVDNIGSFMVCAFPDDEYAIGWNEAIAKIETSAPTADVAPVVHAHWEKVEGGVHFPYRCSRCGDKADSNEYTHCHCGAKMDEEMEKDV